MVKHKGRSPCNKRCIRLQSRRTEFVHNNVLGGMRCFNFFCSLRCLLSTLHFLAWVRFRKQLCAVVVDCASTMKNKIKNASDWKSYCAMSRALFLFLQYWELLRYKTKCQNLTSKFLACLTWLYACSTMHANQPWAKNSHKHTDAWA